MTLSSHLLSQNLSLIRNRKVLVSSLSVFEFLTGTALLFLNFFLSPSALWSPDFLRATSSTFRDLFNERRRGGGGGMAAGTKKCAEYVFPSSAPREEETHIPCLKRPLPRLRQPTDGRTWPALRCDPIRTIAPPSSQTPSPIEFRKRLCCEKVARLRDYAH